ncbi:MAG: GrpB family protein, partial [Anaerolineae bacterium]
MQRQITVVPYDARWPDLFKEEAEELTAVFGEEVLAIHHIGSTAIPGIYAKPIIDVLVEVGYIEKI